MTRISFSLSARRLANKNPLHYGGSISLTKCREELWVSNNSPIRHSIKQTESRISKKNEIFFHICITPIGRLIIFNEATIVVNLELIKNGILFQTCTTTIGRLIIFYEPIPFFFFFYKFKSRIHIGLQSKAGRIYSS